MRICNGDALTGGRPSFSVCAAHGACDPMRGDGLPIPTQKEFSHSTTRRHGYGGAYWAGLALASPLRLHGARVRAILILWVGWGAPHSLGLEHPKRKTPFSGGLCI
jgi:hypothetical protein